jgi:hypothetical protein
MRHGEVRERDLATKFGRLIGKIYSRVSLVINLVVSYESAS